MKMRITIWLRSGQVLTRDLPFISGVEITEEDIQEVKDGVANLIDIPIKKDARGVVNLDGLVVNIRSIEAYKLEAVE